MPLHYQKRVRELLATLEKDAAPFELFDVKKLQSREDKYRIRIGDVRILCVVFWDPERIEVTDIDWHGGAYK